MLRRVLHSMTVMEKISNIVDESWYLLQLGRASVIVFISEEKNLTTKVSVSSVT